MCELKKSYNGLLIHVSNNHRNGRLDFLKNIYNAPPPPPQKKARKILNLSVQIS